MITVLKIPKAAVSMQEGVLAAWIVEDGGRVREGDPIYTLEIEKSTMDIEAPANGLLRHLGQQGTTYKVGDVIGEIVPDVTSAAGVAAAEAPSSEVV
jgi:pyruvate/2-oxoglutarate dehydrogenase complex dihydrolipoamide acyltransferase (E2) component